MPVIEFIFLFSLLSVTVQMAGLYWLAKKRMKFCLTHFILSAILAIIVNVLGAVYTTIGYSATPFIVLSIWQILTSCYGLTRDKNETSYRGNNAFRETMAGSCLDVWERGRAGFAEGIQTEQKD